MNPELVDLIGLVGQIGAPTVAVLISMKYAINGMKEDVTEIKADLKELKATAAEHGTAIAVLKERRSVPRA